MRSNSEKSSRIVLVLEPGLTFHREVIAGIGAFAQATGLKWVFEVETNILKALSASRIADGFIVDTNASEEVELLASMDKYPLVCVSSAESSACPLHVSQVASDNGALIDLAVQHLRDTGLTRFAYFAKPKYLQEQWANERREAFSRQVPDAVGLLCELDGKTDANAEDALLAWVRDLPPRTGVIAVNDSSARDLLQACNTLGRKVPEEISIIGIDNDPLVAALAPLPISSVMQGSHEIGRKAAELLHARMRDRNDVPVRLAILPRGIHPAATSAKTCPMLRDALEFIASHAANGIKAEQVADHLDVSRTTVERLFVEHLGYSAHDEILRTRMGLAKKMLSSRTLSTAEVARRCGFRTQQYMHVVFKRILGLTPREFLEHSDAHKEGQFPKQPLTVA